MKEEEDVMGCHRNFFNHAKDYIVFDLETTGFGSTCEIIEIGAVKVSDGKVVGTFAELIRPVNPIPRSATMVNGITNSMVKNADRIDTVLKRFLAFVGDSVLVGHNINSFDMPILRRVAMETLELEVLNDYIDTLLYARNRLHGLANYKLGTLCEYFGIDSSNAHRALADCMMNMECYKRLSEY